MRIKGILYVQVLSPDDNINNPNSIPIIIHFLVSLSDSDQVESVT